MYAPLLADGGCRGAVRATSKLQVVVLALTSAFNLAASHTAACGSHMAACCVSVGAQANVANVKARREAMGDEALGVAKQTRARRVQSKNSS